MKNRNQKNKLNDEKNLTKENENWWVLVTFVV